jgi:hypothetical protein
MAFENFLIEVGLYGSSLYWNYKDYGHLTTEASWFHNLWNITHLCNGTLTFCTKDQVHSAREHNRSLMLEFFRVGTAAMIWQPSTSFAISATLSISPIPQNAKK